MGSGPEDLVNAIGSRPVFTLGIYAALAIILVTVLIVTFKKGNRKNRDHLRKELQNYADGFAKSMQGPKPRSGNVYMTGDGLYYSRGNKTIRVEIDIDRTTRICPGNIEAWFEGRNYNSREEERILEDIKDYLIENKICKNVEIADDEEEYFEYFDD